MFLFPSTCKFLYGDNHYSLYNNEIVVGKHGTPMFKVLDFIASNPIELYYFTNCRVLFAGFDIASDTPNRSLHIVINKNYLCTPLYCDTETSEKLYDFGYNNPSPFYLDNGIKYQSEAYPISYDIDTKITEYRIATKMYDRGIVPLDDAFDFIKKRGYDFTIRTMHEKTVEVYKDNIHISSYKGHDFRILICKVIKGLLK